MFGMTTAGRDDGSSWVVRVCGFLRSTKEERFLISWATCDRVGVLCTQAKADPCFFVRSAGRSSFQRHFE